MSLLKVRSVKQQLMTLTFLFAGLAVTATAASAMIWEGRPQSTNVIDCRGSLVCGDACDPYRTNWQGVQCFFGVL